MIKRKLKLYDYENCLEATQIDEAKYQLLLKKKRKKEQAQTTLMIQKLS